MCIHSRRLTLLILVLLLLLSIALVFFARRTKTINGRVIDCATSTPIVGATVTAAQSGWGFRNGQLVWDKNYITAVPTDSAGSFILSYRVGSSATLIATASGYLTAQQYEYPGRAKTIRMRRGTDPSEVTYDCRLSSECVESVLRNGVQISWNKCTSPEYRPPSH